MTEEKIKKYVIEPYQKLRVFQKPQPYFDMARRRVYGIIASFAPSSILDVGCGEGKDCEALSSLCDRYVGIDPIEKNLEFARKKHPNPEFHVGFAQELAYPKNSFDVVYMGTVWDILPSVEDMAITIKECIRVARKAVIALDATATPQYMKERYMAIPMNLSLRIERVSYDPVKKKANYVWVIDLTKNMEQAVF